jgi:NAD(P)H dehydrogenase (quinone)
LSILAPAGIMTPAWHTMPGTNSLSDISNGADSLFTHLRPEIFMQNMLGYGGESYVKNGVIRHYIGKARWSWADIEDVAAVAAACLLHPEKHNGQTYRLGYQAATYDEIAAIFTEVIGQPFSYEARPPEEFYRNVLAAGAELAYMKCVFDSYTELTNGTAVKPDEVFDNLPAIIGRKPRTLADFAKKHAVGSPDRHYRHERRPENIEHALFPQPGG